jgi:hypothetical protein
MRWLARTRLVSSSRSRCFRITRTGQQGAYQSTCVGSVTCRVDPSFVFDVVLLPSLSTWERDALVLLRMKGKGLS